MAPGPFHQLQQSQFKLEVTYRSTPKTSFRVGTTGLVERICFKRSNPDIDVIVPSWE